MTPAAQVAAAITVLETWQDGTLPIDRILKAWERGNRYAGSKDRAAIADQVYGALRCWRSAGWVSGFHEPETPRAVLAGCVALDGGDVAAIFSGTGYAPPPVSDAERGEAAPLSDAPRGVRLDLPDWLLEHLEGVPDEALAALRARASLDLRVNLARTDPATVRAALAEEGITAEPGPLSDTCLRVLSGGRGVRRTWPYLDGLIEVQDAASQAVADRAVPPSGGQFLDFCAGGGGKTLAVAARAPGAVLLAHDADPARMGDLGTRADRAGIAVRPVATEDLGALTDSCDVVLVDAPCSGSGAWRREPEAKWRLTPDRLAELTATQAAILREAAPLVAPGGRLVYATCSMIGAENAARIDAFLSETPGFRADGPPLGLTPLDGGDGFFSQTLVRV